MLEGIGVTLFLILVGLVAVFAIGLNKRAAGPNNPAVSFEREEEPAEPMPATRMLETIDRKADTSPSPRVTGLTPGATRRTSGHRRVIEISGGGGGD